MVIVMRRNITVVGILLGRLGVVVQVGTPALPELVAVVAEPAGLCGSERHLIIMRI